MLPKAVSFYALNRCLLQVYLTSVTLQCLELVCSHTSKDDLVLKLTLAISVGDISDLVGLESFVPACTCICVEISPQSSYN